MYVRHATRRQGTTTTYIYCGLNQEMLKLKGLINNVTRTAIEWLALNFTSVSTLLLFVFFFQFSLIHHHCRSQILRARQISIVS
jgi:hypothetical protein